MPAMQTRSCQLFAQAKQWVRDFLTLGKKLQGHQRKFVTPYMYDLDKYSLLYYVFKIIMYGVFRHCMVYHVPTMLKKYGNLRQFSGQGVFKKRLDAHFM